MRVAAVSYRIKREAPPSVRLRTPLAPEVWPSQGDSQNRRGKCYEVLSAIVVSSQPSRSLL